MAIWRKVADLGVTVFSVGGTQLFAAPEFESILRELPDLKLVMAYLGHVGNAENDTSPPHTDFKMMLGLARYNNTFMMVPGLGERCDRPIPFRSLFPLEDVPPLLEMALDAFGPRRLMWASNFPRVSIRDGYANAVRFLTEHPAFRSEGDKEWVFGKTAMSLYKFGES